MSRTYKRRVGRSGEFGRKTVAISLVTADELQLLRCIESHYSTEIEECPVDIVDFV